MGFIDYAASAVTAMLVALVHEALQQFGGALADAPREEQVIEYEQVGFDPGAQQRRLLCGAGQGVTGELGVGLDVNDSGGQR